MAAYKYLSGPHFDDHIYSHNHWGVVLAVAVLTRRRYTVSQITTTNKMMPL